MEPPAVINGAASRANPSSEYALMSCAVRYASRLVLRKSPSSASFGANATECSSMSTLSVWVRTFLKNSAISSSRVTSQG